MTRDDRKERWIVNPINYTCSELIDIRVCGVIVPFPWHALVITTNRCPTKNTCKTQNLLELNTTNKLINIMFASSCACHSTCCELFIFL